MKSPAYAKVHTLINGGYIKDFRQIAEEIQKKTLSKDLHMSFETLMLRINDPGKFRVQELVDLASMLDVDPKFLVGLAADLSKKPKSSSRKKS